ncbi:MAG: malate synthase A [Sphingomonadaceae bacterium]|nr:malate synthase A [Sphingomonadaceae bacterium]
MDRSNDILTPDALAFVAGMHRRFEGRRQELLAARAERQQAFDAGALPDFLPETAAIRAGDWTVAPIPADLMDRRVEITGPTDRKMVINALNSGAQCFMADFEDATAPSWANMVEGQANLYDYWRGNLSYDDPASGKSYRLNDERAVLMVRPRGWHLDERHVGVSGSLFDFGLYIWHNAHLALEAGSGPYFYLPKLESHHEAALWSDVFAYAEERLELARGTIKATVLIETIPAAFEMDEILHALKENVVGLNCGRWDYIFSTIKRLGRTPERLTPDRAAMTMDKAFLAAYSLKLVETCHRRGAFAMGGMAAQIPVKGDDDANEIAFAKVRADKAREARNGHDGTWVAHPGMVGIAQEAFDRPNQLDRKIESGVTREDMLRLHEGPRTEAGVRENVRVGVQYIAAWLAGRGAVPLYNLMEDAATAEICRTQLWQWLRFGAALDDGRVVTRALFDAILADEMAALPQSRELDEARDLFVQLVTADELEEFLTIPAYAKLD